MDIMVEGTGKRFYKPDEVIIRFDFYKRTESYELALENGAKDVQIFIEKILNEMNISKEELKTQGFRVYEEKKFDYESKVEVKLGFAYTQNAMLKIKYDINVVGEFMEKVSKLQNPPKYTIYFSVKNEQESKNEAMAEAFIKAKQKAEAIANAAGKKLKECIKTDFRPFEEKVYSNSSLVNGVFEQEGIGYSLSEKKMFAKDIITNIFTPEDIEISETLYCLWITE